MVAHSDMEAFAAEDRVARIVGFYRRRPALDASSSVDAILEDRAPTEVAALLAELSPAWFDHAVASVYAALMGTRRRKALGAYFTPPALVRHLVGRARSFGVDLANARVRDPAAGGAAFIVPIAREMVALWRADGIADIVIVERLRERLVGREIEPGLARLANALIRRCLIREHGIDAAVVNTLEVVREGDSLEVQDHDGADHEIGNPPFLRLASQARQADVERFRDICAGRLNLYSIFVRRGLAALPAGGILAYIIPASFIGGPEFARFRHRIRQLADVLAIDLIQGRSSIFMDVVQDTCILVLRRRDTELVNLPLAEAACLAVESSGLLISEGVARLPAGDGPWLLPGDDYDLPSTLEEWGYSARIGYLVANRQADRLHEGPGPGRVPLIWAKAIGQDGTFDFERGKRFRAKSWVEAPSDASYLSRIGCVAVQRTSARGQRRRITAAEIPAEFVKKHGGIVAENHVILLLPSRPDAASPAALAEALNRPEVGDQLDRMCGSASIPARLLERVPMPIPLIE